MNAGTPRSVVRILVGIDARRPASWVALAMGAAAGRCIAVAGPDRGPLAVALVVPVVAVVAAIGDLPAGICRGSVPLSAARIVSLWASARAAWPLAGGVIATLLTPWSGHAAGALALAAVTASLATLAAVVVARRCATTAADAAAVAVALGGAGAVAGLAARAAGVAPWGAVGAAAAGWCFAAVLARSSWRFGDSGIDQPTFDVDPPPADALAAGWDKLHLDRLPAVGPIQGTLERIAMATALAAMASWLIRGSDLLPDSGHAGSPASSVWPWAALSAGWYVCLAVPRALLLDGACGTSAWERLLKSAATDPAATRSRLRPLGTVRPGATRFSTVAAVVPAAILAWPPLVGSLVSLSKPVSAWPPLAIVGGLAAAAVILAVLAAVGPRAGASRESLLAMALAVVAAVVIAAGAEADAAHAPAGGGRPQASSRLSTRRAGPPISPSPPALLPSGYEAGRPRFSARPGPGRPNRPFAAAGADFMLREMGFPANLLA